MRNQNFRQGRRGGCQHHGGCCLARHRCPRVGKSCGATGLNRRLQMLTSLGQERILSLSLILHEFVITQTKPELSFRAVSRSLARMASTGLVLVVDMFHQRSCWPNHRRVSHAAGLESCPAHQQQRCDSRQMLELAHPTSSLDHRTVAPREVRRWACKHARQSLSHGGWNHLCHDWDCREPHQTAQRSRKCGHQQCPEDHLHVFHDLLEHTRSAAPDSSLMRLRQSARL